MYEYTHGYGIIVTAANKINEEGEIIPYEDSERRGVTYNDINNIDVFC